MAMQLFCFPLIIIALSILPVSSANANPPNSYVVGTTWHCNNGYRRIGYQCQMRDIPANSFVHGSNWTCKNGYKRIGNQCQKMNVTANTSAGEPKLDCKTGYTRQADSCIKLTFLEK